MALPKAVSDALAALRSAVEVLKPWKNSRAQVDAVIAAVNALESVINSYSGETDAVIVALRAELADALAVVDLRDTELAELKVSFQKCLDLLHEQDVPIPVPDPPPVEPPDEPPADPETFITDFETRKLSPGVFRWFDFQDASQLGDTSGETYSSIPVDVRTMPGTHTTPTLDYSNHPLGALRFDVPSNTSSDPAGYWAANASPDFSKQFQAGESFAIQWRQRFNPAFVNTKFVFENGVNQGGIKQVDISAADIPGLSYNSCERIELVSTTYYQHRFPILYQSCVGCGAHGPYDGILDYIGGGEFVLQNQMLSCLYSVSQSQDVSVPAGCRGWYPDEWMTFEISVTLGALVAGQFVDSRIRYWMARENSAPELIIDKIYTICAANQRYFKLWLMPYMTEKWAGQTHELCQTWYSEVIFGTEYIPFPFSEFGPTTPPPPDPVPVPDPIPVPDPPPPPTPDPDGRVTPTLDSNGKVPDSWWAGLPLNQWLEVSGTDFMSHVTPQLPVGFVDYGGGLPAVFHAWGGAAMDSVTGRMWVFGGGHGDSSNNGLYQFDLNKMTWTVPFAPTVITSAEMSASYASWNANGGWGFYEQGWKYPYYYWTDGRPTATHSYGGMQWIPQLGKIGMRHWGNVWLLDPVAGTYTSMPRAGSTDDCGSVIDESTGRFVLFGLSGSDYWGYQIYDAGTDTLEAHGNLASYGQNYQTKQLFSAMVNGKAFCFQNYILVPQPAVSSIAFWFNPSTAVVTEFPLTNPPAAHSTYPSAGAYAAATNTFYAMQRGANGGTYGAFTAIDMTTGLCRNYQPSGTPPAVQNVNSPYGKFRIWEHAGGTFMVLFQVAGENLRLVRIA